VPRPEESAVVDQLYSAHKASHGLTVTGIGSFDGLFYAATPPMVGRHQDNFAINVLEIDPIFEFMECSTLGDAIYSSRSNVLPLSANNETLTPAEKRNLASMRGTIEHMFKSVKQEFRLLDGAGLEARKLGHSSPSLLACGGILLCNFKTCIRYHQASMRFGMNPPSLGEYVAPCMGNM